MRRLTRHAVGLKTNTYQRMEEHSCTVNGYQTQWGRVGGIEMFAANAVMALASLGGAPLSLKTAAKAEGSPDGIKGYVLMTNARFTSWRTSAVV